MQVKATGWFRDKETGRMYAPGQAYEGPASRAQELAKLGYVEMARPSRPQPQAKEEEPDDGAVRD